MTKNEIIAMMKQTEKIVVKINLVDDSVSRTGSKVGGTPYWPSNLSYPENRIFLAQINFDEVPRTDLLPEKGILQFFVEGENAIGLFSGKDGYKVIYHKEIEEPVDVPLIETECSPIMKPAKMLFEKKTEMISYQDYRFPEEHADEIDDLIALSDYDGSGSKLLGYPHFTQYDPRESKPTYDTLLFQLDSDNEFVMWGDYGVGNFFINKEKLKGKNFSDILYNWDCY